MAKAYYCDYVGHCVRYYLSVPLPADSETERKNWAAVDKAAEGVPKGILELYKDPITIESVAEYAKNENIDQGQVWRTIKVFERRVAELRGLV